MGAASSAPTHQLLEVAEEETEIAERAEGGKRARAEVATCWMRVPQELSLAELREARRLASRKYFAACAWCLFRQGIAFADREAKPRTAIAFFDFRTQKKRQLLMPERAVALDPTYAPAWAALGIRYNYDATYSDGGAAASRRAEAAIGRALALDPELIDARGLHIQARVESGDWNGAYDEASELVRKRPENARAHFTLAYVLRYGGLFDEAMSECETAMLLDPRDRRHRSCSLPFMLSKKYDRALDFVRLDAGSEWAAGTTFDIYVRQGRGKETLGAWKESFSPAGRACFEGQPKASVEKLWAKEQSQWLAKRDSEPKYFSGSMLATCDLRAEALSLLREAVKGGYCAFPAIDNDPLWDKVRSTPEFAAIRKDAIACRDRALAHVQQKSR